jgi:hypothetical protein
MPVTEYLSINSVEEFREFKTNDAKIKVLVDTGLSQPSGRELARLGS